MSNLQQLVQDFYTLQQQRVESYNLLHTTFKSMIDRKDPEPFLKLIPELTNVFSRISKDIISIEMKLKEGVDPIGHQCAKWIRVVQLGEKRKLTATSQLQSLRKCFEFQELPWQLDSATQMESSTSLTEEGYRLGTVDATRELEAAITEINDALDEMKCLVNVTSDPVNT